MKPSQHLCENPMMFHFISDKLRDHLPMFHHLPLTPIQVHITSHTDRTQNKYITSSTASLVSPDYFGTPHQELFISYTKSHLVKDTA